MAFRAPLVYCLLLVLALLASAQSATTQSRMAVTESVTQEAVRICHDSTPCEWAIYRPFTRRVEHIMKNTCECAQGKTCQRAFDDLSVSAFVHRCRLQPTQPPSGT